VFVAVAILFSLCIWKKILIWWHLYKVKFPCISAELGTIPAFVIVKWRTVKRAWCEPAYTRSVSWSYRKPENVTAAALDWIFYKNFAHFSKAYISVPKSSWRQLHACRIGSRARHVVGDCREGRCASLDCSQMT